MAFPGKVHVHTHNDGTVSLTFTENPNMKHKTQKQSKTNIVRTRHYTCAYGSSNNFSC